MAQNTPYPILFHRAGVKAVLPKVPTGVALDVLPSRKIVVTLADALGKGMFPRWDDDVVDVIVHEVVSDQGNFMIRADSREQPEIDEPVVIGKENNLLMVAPLGNVEHPAWKDDAIRTRHRYSCFATRLIISKKW